MQKYTLTKDALQNIKYDVYRVLSIWQLFSNNLSWENNEPKKRLKQAKCAVYGDYHTLKNNTASKCLDFSSHHCLMAWKIGNNDK